MHITSYLHSIMYTVDPYTKTGLGEQTYTPHTPPPSHPCVPKTPTSVWPNLHIIFDSPKTFLPIIYCWPEALSIAVSQLTCIVCIICSVHYILTTKNFFLLEKEKVFNKIIRNECLCCPVVGHPTLGFSRGRDLGGHGLGGHEIRSAEALPRALPQCSAWYLLKTLSPSPFAHTCMCMLSLK